MDAPILVTKLFIPSTRAELVHRSNLIERLNAGLDCKLTLLSAPDGFGKTTLVSHWVEKRGLVATREPKQQYKIEYIGLFDHTILARILIAQRYLVEATGLLRWLF